MSTIVVMPGGFHPFHAGHYALYKSAIDAFPGADVYVAATNDQSERPFPFSIKEKLAKVAGVAPGHFIQVKSPFKAEEITSKYDPNKDVLIFVRSEKDRNEQPKPGGIKKDGTPSYFQPYTGKGMQPFSEHAYFAYLPTVEFGPGITSATEIRNAWPTLNPTRKTAMVMSLYPATKQNPQLAANVVKMMDLGMGATSGLTEDTSSSSLPDVLYHGGEHLISEFKIPPYGVFFSPHKDWAENYGDALTTAKVNTTKVYVADSDNWNDPNSFDAKVLDALFDRDYKTLAVCVKVLMRRGYQALQTQTDSEMVVVFPGTEIQVMQDVDEQFTTNLTTEGNLTEVFDSDSYPLEWEEVNDDEISAYFTTDNGRAGEVLFTIWDYPNHKDVVYLEFAIKGKQNVTGGGDALKIFSTTINATKEFISKNPTNYILFDAEEENRKRLYIRMAKSLETGFELITPAQFAENYPEGQSVQESFGDVFIILQRRGLNQIDEQFTTNLTTEDYLNEFYDTTGKYSGGGEGDDARRQRNARKLIAYSEKQGLRPGTVKVGYSSETGVYQITGLAQRHDTEYDWRFKIDPTSRKFVAVDATQTDADYAPDTFAPVVFDDELKEFTTNLTTEGDLNELHSDTLHSYAGKACDSNTKSIRQADWKRTTPDEREKIHQKVLRRCDGIGRALDKDHAKQENELLKNIPPHLRKKLRLPEPYVDEGSDIQLSKPIKPFNQVKQYPLTALL